MQYNWLVDEKGITFGAVIIKRAWNTRYTWYLKSNVERKLFLVMI